MRGRLHQGAFVASIPAGPVARAARARRACPRRDPDLCAHAHRALRGERVLPPRGRGREPAYARMRRLDHSMIFVLIAGTYTPYCLLVLTGHDRDGHADRRLGGGRRRRGDEVLPRRSARAVGVHVHRAGVDRRDQPAGAAARPRHRRDGAADRRWPALLVRRARAGARTGPTRGPARSATTRSGTRPRSPPPSASTCRSCSWCSACAAS